jgi:hypothetical protein
MTTLYEPTVAGSLDEEELADNPLLGEPLNRENTWSVGDAPTGHRRFDVDVLRADG